MIRTLFFAALLLPAPAVAVSPRDEIPALESRLGGLEADLRLVNAKLQGNAPVVERQGLWRERRRLSDERRVLKMEIQKKHKTALSGDAGY